MSGSCQIRTSRHNARFDQFESDPYNFGTFHCYAIATWEPWMERRPQFFGAYTDITQVPMSGGDGNVSDEIWLADTKSPDCKTNSYQHCWVEAGTFASRIPMPREFLNTSTLVS
jgi:hypothetical protein